MDKRTGAKLDRQEIYLKALASSNGDEGAAREAVGNLSPRTVREWRDNAEFARREAEAFSASTTVVSVENGSAVVDVRGTVKQNLLRLSARNPIAGKVLFEILDNEAGKERGGGTKPCMHCGLLPYQELTRAELKEAKQERERLIRKLESRFERYFSARVKQTNGSPA